MSPSIAQGGLRFALGLRRFLREPISLDDARQAVRQGAQTRDAALLQMLARAVFSNKRSPYLRLFRAAGCELGDVRALVTGEGVEGALRALSRRGIYVTFDEFKGRASVIRGSQRFNFRESDFDNVLMRGHYQITSGGTRGRPTRVIIDLDYLADRAPPWALWFSMHDLLGRPLVFLTPFYPAIVNRQLICARFGQRFDSWFCTARGGTFAYRMATASLHALVRLLAGFPKPVMVPPSDFGRIGDHLRAALQSGAKPTVITSPSSAVRLSLSVQRGGGSLQGLTFLLGGEPMTRPRKDTIEAGGARAICNYGFSEGGTVGLQCSRPTSVDDIHVCLDHFAVIQHARPTGFAERVDALLLTALKPASPKVMLNTEIGDCAVVEVRRCGCPLDDYGLHQHLHTIRSFEKMTGDGVTFKGADLFRILEQVLPTRFGGSLADYQLVESQDGRGTPDYRLLVSPRVGPVDEAALVATFLDELGRLSNQYRVMANQWAMLGGVRVVRQQPGSTRVGKVLPFRTLGPD